MAHASTITTAQVSKDATTKMNKNVVPVGAGGTPGLLLRMFIMIFTGGFVYPNVFVEGMDPTALQKLHQESTEKRGKKI